MTVVYLLRHGEIIQSSPRRFVGRTDLALTEKGRAQMAVAARFFKNRHVDRLVCSPLARCVESAEILGRALALSPQPVDGLQEIHLGEWEGLTVEDVRSRFPGEYEARGQDLAGFRPRGGESFHDVQERSWPVLVSVASAAESVVVVAHGGVNRTLLCRILGMPLEKLFRLGQEYACVNVLRARDEGFRVELLNWSPVPG